MLIILFIILLKINNLGNGYINININVTYITEHSYFCDLRVLLYIMAKLSKIFFFREVVQHIPPTPNVTASSFFLFSFKIHIIL